MLLQWQHFQPHLFSMPGFVHVLEKPFCKANPLVGKPFCRAYSSCRGALLQGSCVAKPFCKAYLACMVNSFSLSASTLCFVALGFLHAGSKSSTNCSFVFVVLLAWLKVTAAMSFLLLPGPLQVPLVLPTANCYCVLVDEHFLSAGPAAAFVGTSAAGFLEASFAEGFFILLLPVAGLFMACSLQSFFRQGGGLPSKPGSFSLSILCSSEPSSCPSSLSSSDEEAISFPVIEGKPMLSMLTPETFSSNFLLTAPLSC